MDTFDNRWGLSESLVQDIVSTILEHADPDRVLLFGSRARQKAAQRSDIDLAVSGDARPGTLRETLNEEVRTLLMFDVIHLDYVDPSLRQEIELEGVILYEKVGAPKKCL